MKKQTIIASLALATVSFAQTEYHIYEGSTHAHTAYTWSHGEHLAKSDCSGILVFGQSPTSPLAWAWSGGYVKSKTGCYGIFVINGAQIPSPDMTVKPDWEEYQGSPAKHYSLAKASGYDFYVTSDHSQDVAFQPPSATNPAWVASKKEAEEASDGTFVALAGYEHSENDGPGATGHINVINSAGMMNALAPGVDLQKFYKWLGTTQANGSGPVVATFNHPVPEQYGNWEYRDPKVTEILTMLEVINSNNKIHYQAFLNALDKGWKVAPVCGNDNHGLSGIKRNTSRTCVLATAKTKTAILDAMKHRRTYATLDQNLQCRYTVNGAIMGSTLQRPSVFHFDIAVSDPDAGSAKDRITKIDIVKDHGVVAQEYTTDSGYSIHWTPTIEDSTSRYFFIRVWTAGGGDAPSADPAKPVAWLAPVWTGR